MKPERIQAVFNEIDDNYITESHPDTIRARRVREGRLRGHSESRFHRFMSSSAGAVTISLVVAFGILGAIVLAGRNPSTDDTKIPADGPGTSLEAIESGSETAIDSFDSYESGPDRPQETLEPEKMNAIKDIMHTTLDEHMFITITTDGETLHRLGSDEYLTTYLQCYWKGEWDNVGFYEQGNPYPTDTSGLREALEERNKPLKEFSWSTNRDFNVFFESTSAHLLTTGDADVTFYAYDENLNPVVADWNPSIQFLDQFLTESGTYIVLLNFDQFQIELEGTYHIKVICTQIPIILHVTVTEDDDDPGYPKDPADAHISLAQESAIYVEKYHHLYDSYMLWERETGFTTGGEFYESEVSSSGAIEQIATLAPNLRKYPCTVDPGLLLDINTLKPDFSIARITLLDTATFEEIGCMEVFGKNTSATLSLHELADLDADSVFMVIGLSYESDNAEGYYEYPVYLTFKTFDVETVAP